MGLDMSYDAFHGAYSAFHRLRNEIANTIGVSLDAMDGWGGRMSWSSLKPDPLHHLLNHSDCDGEIASEHLNAIADRLEQIAPNLPADLGGHISDVRGVIKNMVEGFRAAAANGDPIEFR